MPALIHNPFAWSKIYRASFIRAHQINFGDQYCGEDKVFTWKCYLYASRIYVSKLVMYGHRFFSAQINRMLQRNIKLVESIIEIDAVMRPHFKTKNLENLYDIRLFARDVSGIVLSSESVKILKQNQEYEKAIKLLESWMRVVFESRGVEISKVINASTKRNIMEHFPSFEKILNESEVTQYEFTNRWFESKAKNIWIQLLPKFQPKRILEIGSYEGASTCFLIEFLSKNGGGEIHCIDTWEGGIEHKNGGTAEINMSEVELRFRKNVECFFHKGYSNVELVRLLNKLNQGYFDFIYIDGSHQAPDVLMDAVLSFNLLKKGGLMAFDDYLWSEPLAGGPDLLRCPKPAIDAFTNIFFRKIKIISAPLYQLYLQKIEN
jgi:predicted O-methyltransferase YrrM